MITCYIRIQSDALVVVIVIVVDIVTHANSFIFQAGAVKLFRHNEFSKSMAGKWVLILSCYHSSYIDHSCSLAHKVYFPYHHCVCVCACVYRHCYYFTRQQMWSRQHIDVMQINNQHNFFYWMKVKEPILYTKSCEMCTNCTLLLCRT